MRSNLTVYTFDEVRKLKRDKRNDHKKIIHIAKNGYICLFDEIKKHERYGYYYLDSSSKGTNFVNDDSMFVMIDSHKNKYDSDIVEYSDVNCLKFYTYSKMMNPGHTSEWILVQHKNKEYSIYSFQQDSNHKHSFAEFAFGSYNLYEFDYCEFEYICFIEESIFKTLDNKKYKYEISKGLVEV